MKAKLWKLCKSSLAMAINLQLMIAPNLAMADEEKKESRRDAVTGTLNGLLAIGQKTLSAYQQGLMQQRMLQQQQALNYLRVKPLSPTEVSPLYAQFGCVVLQAKSESLGEGQKCDGEMDQSQIGMYMALLDIAESNANEYDNFTTEGNSKYTQGMGCYKNAEKQFDSMLKGRVALIDELANAIDRKTEAFMKLAEKDVENIKRGEALLTGKNAAKYLADVKFEDKFKDPQCASFMSGSEFKSAGKKGFLGIKEKLFTLTNTPGKSGMSPKEFKGKASNLEKDIKDLGRQVARGISRSDLMSVDPSKLNFSSKFGMEATKAFTHVLNKHNREKSEEMKIWQKDFAKVGADKEAQALLGGIFQENSNIENDIANYERNHKNKCMNKYLQSNFGGSGGLSGRLSDPNISKKANREADSAFKNFVATVLGDDEYTIEEKIKLIKDEEKKSNNSRYTMVTGKSISIKGKKVGASARLRASDIVGIFVDNCRSRFEKHPNSKGKSPRDVVNSLRGIASKYDKYKRTFSTKVQSDVVNSLLNCPKDTSSGKAANSCGGALNMNSANFCLRTANQCASNMMACADKAEKMYDTTRAEQQQIAQRYKQNMDKFKLNLTAEFAKTDQLMKAKGRQLDATFAAGTLYETPIDLDLNMVTDKMMKGIDPSLMIEDPKAYQKMMKKNIAKIKKNTEKQNKEILKAVKAEGDKYKKNYGKQAKEWGKIAKACAKKIEAYNKAQMKMAEEANKAATEQNQKVTEMCRKVDAFNENPLGACDDAADLAKEVLEASAVAGDAAAAAQLKEYDRLCDSANNEESNPFLASTNSGSKKRPQISLEDFCYGKKAGFGKPGKDFENECSTWKAGSGGTADSDQKTCSKRMAKDNLKQFCWYKKSTTDTGLTLGKKGSPSVKCEDGAAGEVTAAQIDDMSRTSPDLKVAYEIMDCEVQDSDDPTGPSSVYTAAKEKLEKARDQYAHAKEFTSLGEVEVATCNSTVGGQMGKEWMNFGADALGRGLAGQGMMGARY
jgi:hypothetical protein